MVKGLLLMLNSLKSVDIVFFILCVAIVAIGVGIYFLIPVLNKKQYKEQRDNLKKREEAFKASKPAYTVKQDTSEKEACSQSASADEGNAN